MAFTNFYGGPFFAGGFFGPEGPTPPPITPATPGGGDSTKFRRIKRRGKLMYWWEDPQPTEVVVLSKEEAVLDPATVEILWAERAALGVVFTEQQAAVAREVAAAKIKQVEQYTQDQVAKQIKEAEEWENGKPRRKRKAILLLLH